MITGLDLVEAMIRVAAKDSSYLFAGLPEAFPSQKIAIEARVYGESPLQDFRPSPGQLLEVSFPTGVRVDTWIKSGSIISSSYDPLLAKIIVSGNDRPEAIQKLSAALKGTNLSGIETNLEYLKQIVQSKDFQNGTYHTTSLDSFKLQISAFEVLDPGPSTTIQDFPGRRGLWHAGIPPSGPMDDFAFRLANRVLGNDLGAAVLECVRSGPTLLFHQDAYVSVAGARAGLRIDDVEVSTGSPTYVREGQKLKLGELQTGCRAYLAIKGGIAVPTVLGSRSTFVLGKLGGHCGRELRAGDVIPFQKSAAVPPNEELHINSSVVPKYGKAWTIKVMPGPHAFPDFFTESSFAELFDNPWKVHYNSNRVGVRLTGPKPTWARSDGGAAGLHPSNIHDSPYSIGSISFTGDEAVILTCDGPSLGGFVVFVTVISAEMWKIGQVKPGDEIILSPVTSAVAMELEENIRSSIENLEPLADIASDYSIYDPILGDVGSEDMKIVCRQAGNRALLLEFGESDFDIRSSFRIYALMEAHRTSPIPGVVELTAGVRSLHVLYNPSVPQDVMVAKLRTAASSFSSDSFTRGIPSRTFNLLLAFDDSASLAAVQRYSRTIREQAPWLPSNVDFLKEINGLETKEEVAETLLSATFLVLGLGDVFCGSPCAIPLDPRHRLLSTKYNPSRSFTPEGAVGIGGQYLCIYAIESPGGYQLIGRTVPIWNRWAKRGQPWMFNIFDQIRFYPISEDALNTARELGKDEELVSVVDGTFDLDKYELWLKDNQTNILDVTQSRWETLKTSNAAAEAVKPPTQLQVTSESVCGSFEDVKNGMVLRAGIAGRCWKSAVSVGDIVEEGQTLVSVNLK
jgi:urea carboxylase/allophanate hydrolase